MNCGALRLRSACLHGCQMRSSLLESDSMNVHHIELFYYVAKYEGISAAIRKMPYGIQQPAVSWQILQLEKELGVKLFNRRPFALTPAGELLYDFAYPFFSQMKELEGRLKNEESQHLRISASASVLGNHLPEVLESMKLKMPSLKLTLREVEPTEIYQHLCQQKADIAVTVLHDKFNEGMRVVELLKVPLVLLVPSTCQVKKFEDLLMDNPDGVGRVSKIPLVGLPEHEALSCIFQDGLAKHGVRWEASMEVSSLEVIQKYVSRGFGAGIGVGIPGVEPLAGCVSLSLEGFPPLVVGAVYQGTLKPVAELFLDEARHYISKLQGGE